MDPQSMYKAGGTASMPYTHCNTRFVNLLDLDIPESASEEEYKQLYNKISRSGTASAQALTDAVSSVSLGIAPPVAFPTETVYGLGADATNRASIAGIFAAKGRPSDNPLIVHVASTEHLERLTGQPIPAVYRDLVKEHWPGPLTILVPIPGGNSVFAPNVHPGQRTIGFRIPSSKYARFFIAATGKPIAAPSANSSGKPSPTAAQHVMDDMNGKINFILDGGSCDVGVESTVVDGLHDPPLILRPGGLSQDDLIAHGKKFDNAWANVGIGYKQAHEDHSVTDTTTQKSQSEAPRAPGMKYKHYAPQGRMILFEGPNSARNLDIELGSILNDLPNPMPNGTTTANHAQNQIESLHIAILTTSSHTNTFASFTLENGTNHIPNGTTTPPALLSSTTNMKAYHCRASSIHHIHLGQSAPEIAQHLFAALRTCDDLQCQYILAEAPRLEEAVKVKEEQKHQFDAVLERMRKAASVLVDS